MDQDLTQERGREGREKNHKLDENQTGKKEVGHGVPSELQGGQKRVEGKVREDRVKEEGGAERLDSGIALICISGGADFEIIRGWCDLVTQVCFSINFPSS
jgi:hypothetical protein